MLNMEDDELFDAIIEEDEPDRSSDEDYGPGSKKKKKKNRPKISTDAWTNANIIKLIHDHMLSVD